MLAAEAQDFLMIFSPSRILQPFPYKTSLCKLVKGQGQPQAGAQVSRELADVQPPLGRHVWAVRGLHRLVQPPCSPLASAVGGEKYRKRKQLAGREAKRGLGLAPRTWVPWGRGRRSMEAVQSGCCE